MPLALLFILLVIWIGGASSPLLSLLTVLWISTYTPLFILDASLFIIDSSISRTWGTF